MQSMHAKHSKREMNMKNFLKNNRGFLIFLLCFGVFRTAIADWNYIPSASMRPNLLEGDLVFYDRLAYDVKLPLSDKILVPGDDPQRGDIVIFSSPIDGTRLIKRLIAVPGDVVEMRDQKLLINGKPAQHAQAELKPEPIAGDNVGKALHLQESLLGNARRIQLMQQGAAYSNFGPLQVPPGHFVMLGDNRDNSADSRVFGFVPRHLLIGRASHILASLDTQGNWLPRFTRFGQKLE